MPTPPASSSSVTIGCSWSRAGTCFRDGPSEHAPDRIEIELHTDPENVAASTGFSIPLYRHGKSLWRQGVDSAGEIDVATIEIERTALPANVTPPAFTQQHLLAEHDSRRRPGVIFPGCCWACTLHGSTWARVILTETRRLG